MLRKNKFHTKRFLGIKINKNCARSKKSDGIFGVKNKINSWKYYLQFVSKRAPNWAQISRNLGLKIKINYASKKTQILEKGCFP